MTEVEWQTGTDPAPMLEFLRGKASDRKLRLFAVACCRRIWHLLIAEVQHWHKDEAAFWQRCLDAVELAERFADGGATEQDLAAITAYPRPALYDADAAMFTAEVRLDPALVAGEAAEAAALEAQGRVDAARLPDGYSPSDEDEHSLVLTEAEYERVLATEKRSQCDLLREIFGKPFRPIPVTSPWRVAKAVALAEGIYADRAFDRLSTLAETLEAAGCDDPEVLDHCRSGGRHVRGCWVTDLLLSKA
jgi:hypothetical protein